VDILVIYGCNLLPGYEVWHEFHESSLERFIWQDPAGFQRRILDVPQALSWNSSSEIVIHNRQKLERYSNLHRGERCFILANGPSLNKVDLTLLQDEFTFGLNRIYLLFDKVNFKPTYYVSINELVLRQFHQEINPLPFPKFVNWRERNLFDPRDENTIFIRTGLRLTDTFVKDPLRPLSDGGTVTYVAIQLAFYMGFSEVILIGLDHSFQDKGVPNKTEIQSKTEDTNHFAPNYFPKGVKWQLPDLRRSEIAYQLARTAFESDGRKILDATEGGKCEVFEKIEFTSLFKPT